MTVVVIVHTDTQPLCLSDERLRLYVLITSKSFEDHIHVVLELHHCCLEIRDFLFILFWGCIRMS